MQFRKYKAMQVQLEQEKAAWDEQHPGAGRSSGNNPFGKQLGSMWGLAGSVLRAAGSMHEAARRGSRDTQPVEALSSDPGASLPSARLPVRPAPAHGSCSFCLGSRERVTSDVAVRVGLTIDLCGSPLVSSLRPLN
jgi:hypothetical protein